MKLLVVDDEPMICYSFKKVFSTGDVEVVTAGTLAEAERRLEDDRPDVVVLDLQLPDGSGLQLFEKIITADSKRPVIFITAHGTADTAIEAMKKGAFDYLIKPIDLEKLTHLLARAFEAVRLMKVPALLPGDPGQERIIGRSPVMQEMYKTVGRIAPQDVNVLILGESGTGKELVARAIYHHSRRENKPFMAINCAALPDNLVESELFGHEQGAFTGALKQRIGKFEQCDGGTLLLDEIGDMPLPVQAKILRLLQEQQFERIGSNKVITTHVRIVAATNQNLEQRIAEGKFRSDLYYRLRVVTISIPPLRERKSDIPELANHFLYTYARELNQDVRAFAPDVMDFFLQYGWPGNVRELQGVVKESILRTNGQAILMEFLPGGYRQSQPQNPQPGLLIPTVPSTGFDLNQRIEAYLADGKRNVHDRIMQEVERELLVRALRTTRGHQGQASDLLGINRTTLRSKLRDLGIALEKVFTDHRETPETEEA